MNQDVTWWVGRPQSTRHCVMREPSFPSPKRGRSPQFSAHVYGGLNGWVDQDATWHGGRSQPRPHCAIWGPSSHSPKGAQPPNFRSISVVAKWLDGSRYHSLGREVGMSPSDIVLDGHPAPLPKRGRSPIFGPFYCDQTAGWIKMLLGTEVDLNPGRTVLDVEPAPLPPRKGHSSPLFSAHVCCGHGRPSQLLLVSCTVW